MKKGEQQTMAITPTPKCTVSVINSLAIVYENEICRSTVTLGKTDHKLKKKTAVTGFFWSNSLLRRSNVIPNYIITNLIFQFFLFTAQKLGFKKLLVHK